MTDQDESAAKLAEAAEENGRTFDAWLDEFFEAYRRRRPVDATFIGFHDRDHLLPDYSPDGREAAVSTMRSLLDRLAAMPTAGLRVEQRHDRQLAAGQLRLELWEDEAPPFYRGNPAVYTGEGVFAVISLFLRDSEPLADRVEAAVARMRALPDWLARGRELVEAAPAPWTARAIREARSAIAYFGRGVPMLARERGIAAPAFAEAAVEARAAFEQHLDWLEHDLAANAIEAVGCGETAFNRYLRDGHGLANDQDAEWVMDRGREALADARRSLEDRARSIDSRRSWQEQVVLVANDHPSADNYLESFSRTWSAAKDAAEDAGLIAWPDYPIEFVPIPASDREAAEGLYYLPYRCPPPFGASDLHRYLVTPIDADTPPGERDRRLRAANFAAITLNHVVHHGGLGHHLQNWHAFRSASRIGQVAGVDGASRIALFCAGTLVEGWACYATDLMDEIGALSAEESLVQAHGRLRMAARAVADVAFHVGAWSLSAVAAFYEREAGMPAPAAQAEAVKNSMFPGTAMMYLIGTEAIHDLRRLVAVREGTAFSLRAFHDRFLSYGAIPVSLIREAMLG